MLKQGIYYADPKLINVTVLELKSWLSQLLKRHENQLLNYLKGNWLRSRFTY